MRLSSHPSSSIISRHVGNRVGRSKAVEEEEDEEEEEEEDEDKCSAEDVDASRTEERICLAGVREN